MLKFILFLGFSRITLFFCCFKVEFYFLFRASYFFLLSVRKPILFPFLLYVFSFKLSSISNLRFQFYTWKGRCLFYHFLVYINIYLIMSSSSLTSVDLRNYNIFKILTSMLQEIFSWSTNDSFRMLLFGVSRRQGYFYETLG